jgi:hypothetical protein
MHNLLMKVIIEFVSTAKLPNENITYGKFWTYRIWKMFASQWLLSYIIC